MARASASGYLPRNDHSRYAEIRAAATPAHAIRRRGRPLVLVVLDLEARLRFADAVPHPALAIRGRELELRHMRPGRSATVSVKLRYCACSWANGALRKTGPDRWQLWRCDVLSMAAGAYRCWTERRSIWQALFGDNHRAAMDFRLSRNVEWEMTWRAVLPDVVFFFARDRRWSARRLHHVRLDR
jgi:hypothetical protein